MSVKYNNIRKQRRLLAYSTRELAVITNVPEKDIIEYEANKKKAKLQTIQKIANATGTKINDWVTQDYFANKLEVVEKPINKDKLLMNFFLALFHGDAVMDTLYDALLDIGEIKITEENKFEFLDFAERLLFSICSIKLKKVFHVCEPDMNKENIKAIKSNDVSPNSNSYINITYDNLLRDTKIIFKNTDIIEVVMQSLIDIGEVDSNGICSEKGNLLLNAIMKNKLKNLINK